MTSLNMLIPNVICGQNADIVSHFTWRSCPKSSPCSIFAILQKFILHLVWSLLTKLQLFILASLADGGKLSVFSGLHVHCLIWQMIKCRALCPHYPHWSLKLKWERAQRVGAEEADVSFQCWQAHYNWPRENMKCPSSRQVGLNREMME